MACISSPGDLPSLLLARRTTADVLMAVQDLCNGKCLVIHRFLGSLKHLQIWLCHLLQFPLN